MRIRTGYSFRTAVGHIDDVLKRIQEIGWTSAPISDRVSTFGFNRWSKSASKIGLKPIFGVELGVVTALGEKKPNPDYWTFWAVDSLRPLHDIIALATNNPGPQPSLLYSQAISAPGLAKVSGERLQIDMLSSNSVDLDFFFGLSPSTPRGLFKSAQERGLKMIATGDNYYPNENDREFYRVALGWRSGTQIYPQHIVSDDEWREALWWVSDDVKDLAIMNRNGLMCSCKAKLQKAELLVPEKAKTLRQLCEDGAIKKKINLADPVYSARLDKELGLIEQKKFEDYFYIIADLMAFARRHMVVGPARGSSCGSLVCYLLDITAVDPIPFDLIFERFIDTTRSDLPDIDIDFSDTKRQMVFDYAEEKYGRERVARLGTVGLFKPRSAMKQAGNSLRIPIWRVERVLDSVIERSSGDSRALQQLEDTLNDTEAGKALKKEFPEILIAGRMEGHPNNPSQHAAGIVITEKPVREYVAVDMRTKSTMCDKKDAEDLNLLKIDALGLTQLSIFERVMKLIGKPETSEFLESIPLDDQKAFDVLNRGHFSGVFQFMGGSLRSLTRQITVNHIEDIISITALARPGPMASGGANSWAKRKTGREPISYPHPIFEPYINGTLGIVVYQEQVMQIGREVGDLSWEDVTALRKAMSKSLGKEFFNQYGDRWKAAAAKKGVPANVLDKVWDDLCAYGSWSFNRSHAVAYGLVSYWCCWLKAHYPVEFAAATLDAESDPSRQIALLRELREEGIDYRPVDPDHSTDKWEPVRQGNVTRLVGPLTAIKGIGPATVREILDCRKTGKPIRATLMKRLKAAQTEIDTLFPVQDRIKTLFPQGLETVNIVSKPWPIIDVQCGVPGEVLILAVAKKIAPKDENEAVNVAKRGYELRGPTAALNLFFEDDTDEIFCKIDRFKFEQLGRDILEKGRPGKSLYAIKGTVPRGFRMISVRNIRYLGELDIDLNQSASGTSRGEHKAAGEQ